MGPSSILWLITAPSPPAHLCGERKCFYLHLQVERRHLGAVDVIVIAQKSWKKLKFETPTQHQVPVPSPRGSLLFGCWVMLFHSAHSSWVWGLVEQKGELDPSHTQVWRNKELPQPFPQSPESRTFLSGESLLGFHLCPTILGLQEHRNPQPWAALGPVYGEGTAL